MAGERHKTGALVSVAWKRMNSRPHLRARPQPCRLHSDTGNDSRFGDVLGLGELVLYLCTYVHRRARFGPLVFHLVVRGRHVGWLSSEDVELQAERKGL